MADGSARTPKAPTGLRECSLLDLLRLCFDLRGEEVEQYLAVSFADTYDHERAAIAFYSRPGPKFCIEVDNRPVCAGGYEEVAPGVWQSWMVGTDASWREHGLAITRASRWVMGRMFDVYGARRLQTNGLAERSLACEWYERGLKMKPEGVWRAFGRNGEDVAAYSILREEWSNGR